MFSRRLLERVEHWRGNPKRWEENNYLGTTPITKRLLQYWFYEEHFIGQQDLVFKYWDCQREAVEILVYVHEVLGARSIAEVADALDFNVYEQATLFAEFRELPVGQIAERAELIHEAFGDYVNRSSLPKFAFNMATGSGKTIVMGMAMAWLYLNEYSRHFLLICPNTIVLDRLAVAFDNLGYFRQYPIVPPEWWGSSREHEANFCDMQVIKQNEGSMEFGTGVIFLTNRHQLYDKATRRGRNDLQLELENIDLGEFYNPLVERVGQYPRVTIINDEAHHSAAEEWSHVIREIASRSEEFHMQLDFSATNKYYDTGEPFEHIVYEYGLKQAIDDGIVKDIEIQTYEGLQEKMALRSKEEERSFLIQEGLKKLADLQKTYADTPAKPVLFVLASTTDDADAIGTRIIEQTSYTSEQVLVIHTNKRTHEILSDDLEEARRVAREIDEPDSEIEVIVSVLMLKEGWDVKSVYCIVPLRAADSEIMVEQIIGRGLRRRFPYKDRDGDYEVEEKLWIIEHPNFKQFWEAEKQQHGYDFHINSGSEDKKPVSVKVENDKVPQYDFQVPILSGGAYMSGTVDASQIDVDAMPAKGYHVADFAVDGAQRVHKALGTEAAEADDEAVKMRFYTFYNFVKAKLVNMIVKDNRLLGGAVKVVIDRKLDRYIDEKLFVEFERDDPEHVKRLNLAPIVDEIREAFSERIGKLAKVDREFSPSIRKVRISDTKPKQTTKSVYEDPQRSVFNCADYDSSLERQFMEKLDTWDGVDAWSHVVPLKIPYYDREYGFHYYIPDFIVKTNEGDFLVETKGEGFAKQRDVPSKKDVGQRWVSKASEVTDATWRYLFVLDEEFERHKDAASFGIFVNRVGDGTSNEQGQPQE